jgi:hypothetical protein
MLEDFSMPISEKFRNFLAYGLGSFGVFATVFFGGWEVGTTVTGSKKEFLENQVKTLEAEVRKRDDHENGLIAELASCQTRGVGAPEVDKGREIGREIKLTVLSGDTGQVGDHLIISVVGIRAAYDPISYVVTANFGAPGKATLGAPGLRIGEKVSYNGYEIRLLAANLATARFGIRETGPGK